MNRNKVKFYYALYESREPIMNQYGKPSGQHKVIYGNPIEEYANISAAKGETQTRQFGENESYDKVIVMDLGTLSIDEYSILWVDTEPQLNEDGSLAVNDKGEVITPHDYVVKKVAKSLNNVSIAISKVTVSG
ncbi:hypothetical protein [Anaerotruncus sp. DFI.9.16]|uniref:hypothetical protein n=1 Tax=Anaerotruncus sp. DFI.9.16 TaxID=2965275 RepID=UPI00210DD88B|nr:hypothetical protein [Anaerotruncus sp. DFI.9.16]MCQ4894917.1 hypothetical protein [Anaerotruncus sp. DFI.9.16]